MPMPLESRQTIKYFSPFYNWKTGTVIPDKAFASEVNSVVKNCQNMTTINSIIVFGATGRIGLEILKRGISEDLEVTAYARNPDKISNSISGKLHRVIQGDILDRQRVEDAIEGHDAVLSAIGSGWHFGETTIVSEGCKNIIAGMKRHDVTKIIVVSLECLLPGKKIGCFYRKVKEDHARQLEILKEESGSIQWIAMMVPKIKNNSSINQDYKVENKNTPGASVVTTGELADFMVKVFMDKTSTECFQHNMLGISSHPKITSTRWFKICVFSVAVVIIAGAVLYYGYLPTILLEYLDGITKEHEITNKQRDRDL